MDYKIWKHQRLLLFALYMIVLLALVFSYEASYTGECTGTVISIQESIDLSEQGEKVALLGS